jgi:pyoverdine/dityrosine biosynthesis protein Dit1
MKERELGGVQTMRGQNKAYRDRVQNKAYRDLVQNKAYRDLVQNKAYLDLVQNKAYRDLVQNKAYRDLVQNKAYRDRVRLIRQAMKEQGLGDLDTVMCNAFLQVVRVACVQLVRVA